ncbi:hypothetical protein A2118_01315 [Candidatus Kaiserbacteria bacterium GWA2_50_9]|uniref:Blue (type 1) copper domain-containing protein n=1 Tax=Candidatus Kaiserbacteria bacterium GWA2_50_9 TaxID=1798474 RepID=A0A1F6BU21_9BACT|nr:MAG: hypothetical protein A2118_01315 [Candidatus Kaiserbacteria bacterium GWA2_50_9]
MKKVLIAFGIVLVFVISGGAYYAGTKTSEKDLKAVQAAAVVAAAPRVGDASTLPAVPTKTVNIQKGAFDPATITIKKGETVIWMNTDAVAHTVTSDEGGIVLNSQSISAGHAFTHTFTEVGTVKYHCAIDRAMTGTIVVEN